MLWRHNSARIVPLLHIAILCRWVVLWHKELHQHLHCFILLCFICILSLVITSCLDIIYFFEALNELLTKQKHSERNRWNLSWVQRLMLVSSRLFPTCLGSKRVLQASNNIHTCFVTHCSGCPYSCRGFDAARQTKLWDQLESQHLLAPHF